MVVNLCLPHFQTSAQSNKLSADGHDVSNLLSGDPVVRRRGFKLEYFLRPPLHVTLHFSLRVELCRVDVELWPCGLDQGCVSRKLEILTCSETQENGQFKLVGRCDLREEAFLCFKHPNFRPRAPFLEPPPESPAQARQLELWSRGPQSISSVAQLRITVPYGGGGSAMGIKSLSVWGIPARCCPPSELERFHETYLESLKPKRPAFQTVPTFSTSKPNPATSDTSIPEEFLDPLTQELMLLPMILPSGMIVDNSTLEEYQKQEATWGRLPNDPFTGIPFTKDSKPLPNPLLKTRIDGLVLRTGCTGSGSRNNLLNKPQPSKLTSIPNTEKPTCSTDLVTIHNTQETEVHSTGSNCTDHKTNGSTSGLEKQRLATETLRHGAKRKYQPNLSNNIHKLPSDSSAFTKMPRTDASLTLPVETHTSQASHEQRLSDSLEQALNSALQGLPTFTSQSRQETDTTAGESRCGSCSCSLTVYSSSPPAYCLPCSHLLCRSCLQRQHPPSSSHQPVTCPTCKSCASPSKITRVHH